MGQQQSVGRADESAAAAAASLDDVYGFQIVRVVRDSPAHRVGMVPYFDIITALDHITLSAEEMAVFAFFREYVREHAGKTVCFTLYNLYTRAYRDVECTLSAAAATATAATAAAAGRSGTLLGCSVEWAHASACVQRGWHLVEVLAGSPAAHCADLQADRDYILGMQQPEQQYITLLRSEQDMYARLDVWHSLQRSAQHFCDDYPDEHRVAVPHTLLLLLYDSEARAVKEVVVDMGTQLDTPLGVRLATGLLHRVPCEHDDRARLQRQGDARAAQAAVLTPPVMSQFAPMLVDECVEATPAEADDDDTRAVDDKRNDSDNGHAAAAAATLNATDMTMTTTAATTTAPANEGVSDDNKAAVAVSDAPTSCGANSSSDNNKDAHASPLPSPLYNDGDVHTTHTAPAHEAVATTTMTAATAAAPPPAAALPPPLPVPLFVPCDGAAVQKTL